MLAVTRGATSLTALPVGRLGLLEGAVAAWARQARAETTLPNFQDEVCECNKLQRITLQPVDDGLEELRQRIRIRAYGLKPMEEKLVSLMREFKQDEKDWLRFFADAEHTGDEGRMRRNHSYWKGTTEKMELLQSNPCEFVRQFGYLYALGT